MRVLIVPDKFKGTLTAMEAAETIAQGWTAARPRDTLDLLPMSDGGDGFGDVVGRLLGAQPVQTQVRNAARQPALARWYWSANTRTALIETAQSNGLAQLAPGRFHPFELDTFGVGELLLAALGQGAQTFIVGIGGSATNDAGFGMARALGFTFLDSHGQEISAWTGLAKLDRILPSPEPLIFPQLIIATDVQNPLLGPNGATRVYGPQKGLKPDDFPIAESALARLAGVVERDLGVLAQDEPGTGAAGGLGYGLRVFAQGQFRPGFDVFARCSNLRDKIAEADLIITAEGAIDEQTLMGKGTGSIAKLCHDAAKPCLGLAGWLNLPSGRPGLFRQLWGVHPHLASLADSQAEPGLWLQRLAQKAAAEFATAN